MNSSLRAVVVATGVVSALCANTSHYEKPPCQSDEVNVQVQGLQGQTCAPKCAGTSCPTDVPAGTTAKPQCVLQDSSSGDKYCALTCFLGGCPAGSTCRHAGLVGLCMYDSSEQLQSHEAPMELGKVVKNFEKYVRDFDKKYESPSEWQTRFTAFATNSELIESENARETNTFTLDVNEFADLSLAEFKQKKLGYTAPSKKWGDLPRLGLYRAQNKALPSSVDWNQKGAVTPVKNQGQCGSCWAFSTTGSLEGAWKIATGNLVSLSEQQLVDCASKFGEQGCNGGEMDSAFQYVKQNGLDTEASYSYKGRSGTCQATSGTTGIPVGAVTGYHDVAQSEQALMEAVAQQPVSIAIEADKSVFQLYRSGVLTGSCGTSLDHGVLAVGYGVENGQNYWLMKNSWGTSWGISGFGKLLRGKNSKGECGILMQPSYPAVSGSPGPSPPAPPAPPAPPSPPPSGSHYEKPPCQSDEVDVQVQGFQGAICAPKCSGTSCPTDVPAGTTAKPQCVLQDSSSGDKYCALTCFLGGCPAGSTCRHSGLVGLCMYDTTSKTDAHTMSLIHSNADGLINV